MQHPVLTLRDLTTQGRNMHTCANVKIIVIKLMFYVHHRHILLLHACIIHFMIPSICKTTHSYLT